jgi:hypothetical protein
MNGTWSDGTNNNCSACTANCQICNTSSTCLSCANGYSITANGSCSSCPPGQFSSGGYCTVCVLNCLICSSYSTCHTCSTGYTVNAYGICTTSSSVICPVNCSICSSVACLICSPGYGLYDTGCKLCAENQFSTGSLPCINCSTYCQICASVNTCKTCKFGFTLINGVCYCSIDKYIINNTCVSCGLNC